MGDVYDRQGYRYERLLEGCRHGFRDVPGVDMVSYF